MPQTPSTRWCPTPEQLMILEEMYRTGVRTPNASQIQQITAHLAFYGKIEGKNVFYWFQNHKARDRQKLRRRLTRHHHLLNGFAGNPLPPNIHFPSPTPQQYHQYSPPLHFLPNQVQEETQGMNLLSKLETGEGSSSPSSGTVCGCEWMVMIEPSSAGVCAPLTSSCCMRPLRTLELFPTKTTGLKDECNASKSSSCSTSIN